MTTRHDARDGPTVSVVIPARDAASTLPLQLAALAAQSFEGTWEVIVVDNGSTDGTSALVEAWSERVPELRCISVSAIGASHARNAGARCARGDLLLFCEADDAVAPDWIAAMVQAARRFDVVAGSLEYDTLSPPEAPRPHAHATLEAPRIFGIDYAISANLGCTRAVFDTIGGFDESFGVGGDDVDFSWRAQRAGFSLGFSTDAIVHYRLRGPLLAFACQQYRYSKGDAHLYAKHLPLGDLPPRPFRLQAKAVLGDVYDVVRLLPGVTARQGRWALAHRLARLIGGLAGAFRWGVFPP
jgi:glycosyltransferase involved in cell wall biosynthesis